MLKTPFAVLGIVCGVFQAAESPPGENPSWVVPRSAEKQLAAEVDREWFSIRPPQNYAEAELDVEAYREAGIKVAAWIKETDDVINPAITIMRMPALETPPKDEREFFDGLFESLTARWPDTRGSKVISGRWNGRSAYRYTFTATADDKKIAGVVFASMSPDGTFVVSAIHPLITEDDHAAFQTLKFAAMSVKPKRK